MAVFAGVALLGLAGGGVAWLVRDPSSAPAVERGVVGSGAALDLVLADGATIHVPRGAVPEGEVVEAAQLDPADAEGLPERLGRPVAVYRVSLDATPEQPVEVRLPLPQAEDGQELQLRHERDGRWRAVSYVEVDGVAVLWRDAFSRLAWTASDAAARDEEQRRQDIQDRVADFLRSSPPYPDYLLGRTGWHESVADVWGWLTDRVTGTRLQEQYDELYQTGMMLDGVSLTAARQARDALDDGDLDRAEERLQHARRYRALSFQTFSAATEVLRGNIEAGIQIAEGIQEGSQQAMVRGLRVVNPKAATVVDWAWVGIDYVVDRALAGQDEATRNLVVSGLTKVLLGELEFDELGGQSLLDWAHEASAAEISGLLEPLLGDTELLDDVVREVLAKIGGATVRDAGEDLGAVAVGVWIDALAEAGQPIPSLPDAPSETDTATVWDQRALWEWWQHTDAVPLTECDPPMTDPAGRDCVIERMRAVDATDAAIAYVEQRGHFLNAFARHGRVDAGLELIGPWANVGPRLVFLNGDPDVIPFEVDDDWEQDGRYAPLIAVADVPQVVAMVGSAAVRASSSTSDGQEFLVALDVRECRGCPDVLFQLRYELRFDAEGRLVSQRLADPGDPDASATAGETCSGRWEGRVGLAAQGDLPAAVARTRQEVFDAAVRCDYQRLAALATPGFTGPGAGAEDLAASLRQGEDQARASGEAGPLAWLIRTLNLSSCVEATGVHQWPAAACADADARAWAELEGLYSPDQLTGMRDHRQEFLGHRLGITAGGDWLFFFSGT